MLKFNRPEWRITYIIKSDRVNALRKQYDAFLEEDKKRKERNEYILGRLDNMRYSSTAVQIRHKPIVYGDLLPVYNRSAPRQEQLERRDILIARPPQHINQPDYQNHHLDVPRNYLGNTSLLKEISEKYILIPKLRTSLVNDYLGNIPPHSLPPVSSSSPQANNTSNEDWKSKYDILDQLKKKETEEPSTTYGKDELVPVKESVALSRDDKVMNDFDSKKDNDDYDSKNDTPQGYDLQNYNTQEYTIKYEHEIPEKDLAFDKIEAKSEPNNVENFKVNNIKEKEPSKDHAPKSSDSSEINTVYDYTIQSQVLGNNLPTEISAVVNSNIEENAIEVNPTISNYSAEEAANVYNNSEHKLNENPHQEEYPLQYEQPVEIEGTFPDSENVYLEKEDYSPIQVLNNTEFVEKINIENPTDVENTALVDDQVVQYPVDMLNVDEFTPNADVKLIDGVNVNPNYLASEQENDPVLESNIEPQADTQYTKDPQSGIDAFEAEQRDMFYSEDASGYAYDQQAENVYNQEYDPTQAQDYAYYESPAAVQEQEYPVEVNEHEESSTRYDQNYEQQYAADYANQEYQGIDPQQYHQPEDDQTQQQYQDYEYQQPEQETAQNVVQALDSEQGYVDVQNLETTNNEQPITPTKQAVDQKES